MKMPITYDTIHEAQHLRKEYPEKYGVPGAKRGHPGYVFNGWRLAVSQAEKNLRSGKDVSKKVAYGIRRYGKAPVVRHTRRY